MLKKSTLIVVVAVLLVVAGGLYQLYQQEHQFRTAGEFAQFLATIAVTDAQENNHITLDYTPESIQKVEQILANLHDQYAKNPSSVDEKTLGSAYGAYIGEVIRRSESSVKWERDHPVVGEKSYPLEWGGGASFPMGWCRKRIVNGPEDNVWQKYLYVRQKRHNSKIAAQTSSP